MDQELQKSAANLLDAARAAGQDALTFIQTQSPDIARQLVSYKLIESIFVAVFCGTISIFMLIYYRKLYNWAKKGKQLCEPTFVLPGILMFIIFCISSSQFLCNFVTSIQCIYAPKAVLFNMVFHK